MVLVVVLRYFFGIGNIALQESITYLHAALFTLAAAYTLALDEHVRVDVFYGRLGERGKAWVDLLGTLFFLLPFCAFGIYTSWAPVAEAWRTLEVSPDPGGPPRYPIKTLLPAAVALRILQGLVIAAKKVQVLRGRSP